MDVRCPGCHRHLRVGLADASSYYEHTAGLEGLSGSCPRRRIAGALPCDAQKELEAMRAEYAEAHRDEELAEA